MSAKHNGNGNGPGNEQDENNGIRNSIEFHAVGDVFKNEPGWEEGRRFKGVYHEGGYVFEKTFKTADEAKAWVEAAIRGPKPPRRELRLTWAYSTKGEQVVYTPALIVDGFVVKSDEVYSRDAALWWIAFMGNDYNVEYQDVPLPSEEWMDENEQ